MTKTKIIFIFLLFFLLFIPHKVFSLDCTEETISGNHTQDEWNQILTICQQQKNKYNSQKYDAQTQLNLINLKYDTAIAQFRQTEQKIQTTQLEIEKLNSKIEGLDISLNYLSKLLLNKIVEGYKRKSISIFDLLLDSLNANDLIGKIKYLRSAQANNQKLLIQVQEAKLNFEEQKTLRDNKKIELDNLKVLLVQQQTNLQYQKKKKDEDIAAIKLNLAETERIFNIAYQQIASFKSFVSNTGTNSDIISANQFGSGSDGSYYSQRDIRWANQTIGSSSENILNVGCLLTSISIVGKKNGSNITPSNIASEANRFYYNTAWMNLPWAGVAGKNYTHVGTDDESITQELNNSNYVIVGVGGCANGGSHFVVLIKKDGSDYIMHDPIYGPDIKFSSHYGNICSAATFK